MKNNRSFAQKVGQFIKNNWHIVLFSLVLAVATALAIGYVS